MNKVHVFRIFSSAGETEGRRSLSKCTFTFIGSPHYKCSCSLTFGKPASSQSLIMPMKSVALAATNSGLNALMTEFSSKVLWETGTRLTFPVFHHRKLLKHRVNVWWEHFWAFCFLCWQRINLQTQVVPKLFDLWPLKTLVTGVHCLWPVQPKGFFSLIEIQLFSNSQKTKATTR